MGNDQLEWVDARWAEALAQEHGHQQELLAMLRDEVGAFAHECAAALTALDAFVGLGPVATLIDIASVGTDNVARVRDIGRRLPGFAPTAPRDPQVSELYACLGGRSDLSPALVDQVGEYLRAEPGRPDRQLLNAIVDAAAAGAPIEEIVGPASVAALGALAPLARWTPSFVQLDTREEGHGELIAAAANELTTVLQSAATASGETIAADAVPVADSLRDTVEHVERAVLAIAQGRLEKSIAEARRQLEADLDGLRAVHELSKRAPYAWRAARRAEHAVLVEEVRQKLEKVGKVRHALSLILPHLQIAARALATVEKLRSIEGRLDPGSAVTVDAALMSLLLAASETWRASLPEPRHPGGATRPLPRRWLLAGAVVLLAAGAAIAVSLSGGSTKTVAPNTILNVVPAKGIPSAPTISPLRSTLDPKQQATFYSISVSAARQGKPIYIWHFTPPKDNPSCNRFGSVLGFPNRAVWHHADTDGCTHTGTQHLGTVTVTVTTRYWECTESFTGTLTANGDAPKRCTRL